MTTTTSTITYTKLRDGSWGLRGHGLTAGATVRVTKRDGSSKTETVGRVLWTGDGVSLATIAGGGGSTRRSTSGGSSSYRDDMVTCRHCRQRTPGGDDWCMACGRAGYEY